MPLQMTRGWTGLGAGAYRDPDLVAEDGDPADAGVHQVNARALAGDVASDDEGLDGFGALVGVQGLQVGHVPHHVEVEEDAVAAEQVPGLGDDLAGLAGVVHLGDGGDRVC